jgi:hypothetical protein
MISRLILTCIAVVAFFAIPEMDAQDSDILNQKLKLQNRTDKVSVFLSQVIKQKSVNLSYAPGIVDTDAEITLPSNELTLKQFLNCICKGNSIRVYVLNKQIILKRIDKEAPKVSQRIEENGKKDSIILRDSLLTLPKLEPLERVTVCSYQKDNRYRERMDKLVNKQIKDALQLARQKKKQPDVKKFQLLNKWNLWTDVAGGPGKLVFSDSVRGYHPVSSPNWSITSTLSFRLGKNFFCEPGIGFLIKNTEVELTNSYNQYPYDFYRDSVSESNIRTKVYSIVTPVLFQYFLQIKKDGYLGIGLGGYFTVNIAGTNRITLNNKTYSSPISWKGYSQSSIVNESANVFTNLHRFDAGGLARITYSFGCWRIGITGQMGATSLLRYENCKINYVGLSLGYLVLCKR